MVNSQPRISPKNLGVLTSLEFSDTNGSSNLGQTSRPSDSQQKKKKEEKKNETKRTCRIVDFAVPADHRVKLKERGKRDKYQTLLEN